MVNVVGPPTVVVIQQDPEREQRIESLLGVAAGARRLSRARRVTEARVTRPARVPQELDGGVATARAMRSPRRENQPLAEYLAAQTRDEVTLTIRHVYVVGEHAGWHVSAVAPRRAEPSDCSYSRWG